jgi:hypothetical protein
MFRQQGERKNKLEEQALALGREGSEGIGYDGIFCE